MSSTIASRLNDLKAALQQCSTADQLLGCMELEYLAAEALQCGEPSIAGEALFYTGFLRGELGDRPGALEAYNKALEIGYEKSGLFYNLGICYRELQQPNEALACYLRSLELEPGRGDSLANMAFVYEDLGNLEQAEECFRLGSELLSHHPDAVCNLSYSLLRRAAYQEGWSLYELRRKTVPHSLLMPTWQPGDSVRHKKILTIVEQGYGDVLMFAGLLPELTRDASKVALICDERLERLLRRSLPSIDVSSTFVPTSLANWDHRLCLGSLGFLYRNCTPAQFKPVAPFLKPEPPTIHRCMQQQIGRAHV